MVYRMENKVHVFWFIFMNQVCLWPTLSFSVPCMVPVPGWDHVKTKHNSYNTNHVPITITLFFLFTWINTCAVGARPMHIVTTASVNWPKHKTKQASKQEEYAFTLSNVECQCLFQRVVPQRTGCGKHAPWISLCKTIHDPLSCVCCPEWESTCQLSEWNACQSVSLVSESAPTRMHSKPHTVWYLVFYLKGRG